MLTDPIDDPDATDPDAIRSRHLDAIRTAVGDRDAGDVAEETGVDRTRVESLQAGEEATLTVEEATELLALGERSPDAETLRLEVRDHLMLEMSTAVTDVERLASDLDGDIEARELQQKIEGRQPLTLAEYARITHALAARAAR